MTTSIDSLPSTNEVKSGSISTSMNKSHIENPSQVPNDSVKSILNEIKSSNLGKPVPLPDRDRPRDTQRLVRDPKIRPDYIKKEPKTDYIREYDKIEALQKKAKVDEETNGYEQYFPYALIAALYVLLQLPPVKRLLRHNIPGLFSAEGEPRLSYNIVLGLCMAVIYYCSEKYVL